MRLSAALMLVLAFATIPVAVTSAADPPRTVEIIATDDMKYSVPTINAKPGEQIRIRLVVKGTIPKIAMAHNVVVLKLGTDVTKLVTEGAPHRATDFIPPAMLGSVIAKTALAGPGEVVQVTFTVPAKAGRYPFICTFAGHYQAGMKGTLVVK
jgi:azurin